MSAKKIFVSGILLVLAFTGCGGGGEDTEVQADTTSASDEGADSVSSTGGGTLRSAAEDILETQQAPSGASALIEEAHSAADQANQRTQELQELMGDM
jgi:hypothetical protein